MTTPGAGTSSTDLLGSAAEVVAQGTRLEPGRLRPTRRMLVVPTLGVILWGAGANAGAGFLIVLAGGLLASVPWAFWTARRGASTVHVRRVLPARAIAGQPVDVRVEVAAKVIGAVVVHDGLSRSVGLVQRPGDAGVLVAQSSLARGLAIDGTVTVEVTDPFGLFRASVAGKVPGAIEVWPALQQVNLPQFAAAARRRAQDRPRKRGAGSETDGTREYRHGDSPRSVHWRSSARRDELVVREFVGDASGTVRVVVVPGPWDVAALDAACLIAAAVASSAQRAGAEAELGIGDEVAPWTETGRQTLASLSPHLGAAVGRGLPTIPVPGAGPALREADVELLLTPNGGDLHVHLQTDGTTKQLGVFTTSTVDEAGQDRPTDADPVAWFVSAASGATR